MGLTPSFLPGVPAEICIAALTRGDGNELGSGKFASGESSAALAVNTFGWFLARPGDLPPFPNLSGLGWPPLKVEVERQVRFPWRGGRHPWLDAAIETETHFIGVESKRFEPFRDRKTVAFSSAYDRDEWGSGMRAYEVVRDALKTGDLRYQFLDAAQLVKHAFGLITQARRSGKVPVLLYLFAEPKIRGKLTIQTAAHDRHRAEIADFSERVHGSGVTFVSSSYREWLATWSGAAAGHAAAVLDAFAP